MIDVLSLNVLVVVFVLGGMALYAVQQLIGLVTGGVASAPDIVPVEGLTPKDRESIEALTILLRDDLIPQVIGELNVQRGRIDALDEAVWHPEGWTGLTFEERMDRVEKELEFRGREIQDLNSISGDNTERIEALEKDDSAKVVWKGVTAPEDEEVGTDTLPPKPIHISPGLKERLEELNQRPTRKGGPWPEEKWVKRMVETETVPVWSNEVNMEGHMVVHDGRYGFHGRCDGNKE